MIMIMILSQSKLDNAENMWKNMPHTCGICSIYAPHILPNSVYFASKSSTYFKKILRYKPASLIRNATVSGK